MARKRLVQQWCEMRAKKRFSSLLYMICRCFTSCIGSTVKNASRSFLPLASGKVSRTTGSQRSAMTCPGTMLSGLPDNMVPYVQAALLRGLRGQTYSGYGW